MQIYCLPVGMLQANCYILSSEAKNCIVVDPGGNAEDILNFLEQKSLKVRVVLLTHAHFDHMLGAKDILDKTGAQLLAPREEEAALTDPRLNLLTMVPGAHIALMADRLLDDGDLIILDDCQLKVIHTPGHTPGSCCYQCGNILLTGDTLFAGSIGRTDFPGGDMTALRRSLRRLSELEGEYTVLSGHGEETTLTDEKNTNPYMQ